MNELPAMRVVHTSRWRRLRQWAARHEWPVLVLSALCASLLVLVTAMRRLAEDTMHQEVADGVHHFVIKPFEDVEGHLTNDKLLRMLMEVPWQIFDHYGTVAPPMVRMLMRDENGNIMKSRDSPDL